MSTYAAILVLPALLFLMTFFKAWELNIIFHCPVSLRNMIIELLKGILFIRKLGPVFILILKQAKSGQNVCTVKDAQEALGCGQKTFNTYVYFSKS